MYDAIDAFLGRAAWHSGGPEETRAFHRALDQVVRDPDFHPEELASYMRHKAGSIHHGEVNRFVDIAWVVHQFLADTANDRKSAS